MVEWGKRRPKESIFPGEHELRFREKGKKYRHYYIFTFIYFQNSQYRPFLAILFFQF